jgi:serine/threonine protein kinase
MSLEIGQVIAERYRVDAFLGKGGMAEVYKVWDSERAVFLALKLLREDLAEDKVFLRRFQREGQTLARLQHPCIVRFYGIEQWGDYAYILMDYVDGTSLRKEVFRSNTGLKTARILEVLRPVCSALYYAHKLGLVHCDVKPANIMIQNNGTVLLADFGIARVTESATTTTMVGAGTPAYMAPEQAMGANPVPQTDIYSLGVVLYELVTGGERPFNGERAETTGTTMEKVRWEQINLAPLSPRKINPNLDPQIEKIILKCLEKDPYKRYTTALDLLNDLAASAGETIAEPPPPPPPPPSPTPPPPRPPDGRRRSRAPALWVGLVVILAVIIFALMNLGGLFNTPPAAPGAAPGSSFPSATTAPSAAPSETATTALLGLNYQSANGCLSIRYPAGWSLANETSSGANSAGVTFASIKLDSSISQIPDNYLNITIAVDSTESIKKGLPASVEFTPGGLLRYVRDNPSGFTGNSTPTSENFHILQDVQETTLSGYPASSLIIEVLNPNGVANQKVIFDLALIMTDFNQAAVVYGTASETGWETNKAMFDQMLASLVLKPGAIPAPTAGPQPAPTSAETPPPAPTAAPPANLTMQLNKDGVYLREGPNIFHNPTTGKLAAGLTLNILG